MTTIEIATTAVTELKRENDRVLQQKRTALLEALERFPEDDRKSEALDAIAELADKLVRHEMIALFSELSTADMEKALLKVS